MSTSAGDDVCTMQNVRGATQILGRVYDSNKKVITSNWGTDSFGLTNAICVGTKLNNENDRIYWFIKADEADCIAELQASVEKENQEVHNKERLNELVEKVTEARLNMKKSNHPCLTAS